MLSSANLHLLLCYNTLYHVLCSWLSLTGKIFNHPLIYVWHYITANLGTYTAYLLIVMSTSFRLSHLLWCPAVVCQLKYTWRLEARWGRSWSLPLCSTGWFFLLPSPSLSYLELSSIEIKPSSQYVIRVLFWDCHGVLTQRQLDWSPRQTSPPPPLPLPQTLPQVQTNETILSLTGGWVRYWDSSSSCSFLYSSYLCVLLQYYSNHTRITSHIN